MTNNRKHEAKSWLYALLGVVVGATGAYFWMQDSAPANEEPDAILQREMTTDEWMFDTGGESLVQIAATPMPPDEAFQKFTNYQGTNPNVPLGVLNTVKNGNKTSAIGMLMSKQDLFAKLDTTAKRRGLVLTGYYAIFAKQNSMQHRMLFMGVYHDGNDNRLMLPLHETDNSCIYDWIMPCPDFCPKESEDSKLWDERNWAISTLLPSNPSSAEQ